MPRKAIALDDDVKLVRVRARRTGYYEEQRRRPGDVFDIPENLLPTTTEGWRDCWLEPAKAGSRRTVPGSLSALQRQIQQQQEYQQTQDEETAEVI